MLCGWDMPAASCEVDLAGYFYVVIAGVLKGLMGGCGGLEEVSTVS